MGAGPTFPQIDRSGFALGCRPVSSGVVMAILPASAQSPPPVPREGRDDARTEPTPPSALSGSADAAGADAARMDVARTDAARMDAARTDARLDPAHADALRALFERARGGDQLALDDLCRQMRPRLYRAAWSILRDRDEADDVAQEALIRAVTRRFLFLGRGSVAGWMTRIAVNLAKNRVRDVVRRRTLLETASPEEKSARGAEATAPPTPDAVALEREHRARLEAALEDLPERQRDVVRLHVVAQLDFAAVADALGITQANARVTFSIARRKLLAELSQGTSKTSPTSRGDS